MWQVKRHSGFDMIVHVGSLGDGRATLKTWGYLEVAPQVRLEEPIFWAPTCKPDPRKLIKCPHFVFGVC